MRSVTPGPHTESRFRGGRMDKRDSQPNDTDTSRVTRVWQLSMSRSGPVHTKSNRASRCFGPSFAARHRALATNDLSSYASAPTRPARGVVAGRAGAPRGRGTGRLRPLFRADVVPARGSPGCTCRLQAQVRPSGPSPFPIHACWGHDGRRRVRALDQDAPREEAEGVELHWQLAERRALGILHGLRWDPAYAAQSSPWSAISSTVSFRPAGLAVAQEHSSLAPVPSSSCSTRVLGAVTEQVAVRPPTTRAPSHPHTPRARERT